MRVDISDHAARFVREGQPIDKFARLGSGTLANVLPALAIDLRGFKAALQKSANNRVGKECHSSIGVMDDEPLLGAQKLVGDYKRPYRIVAGATACVANDMSVALAQAGILCRIKSSVHACQDCETPGRRKSESRLFAESFGVFAIGGENFVKDFAHGW
jgi:hypothetical protein